MTKSKLTGRTATSNSSKVGSKKVYKKSLSVRRFNLQSRKVQFFVVIFIVAILGGGYFTFKSFAATSILHMEPGSPNATFYSQFTSYPDCKRQIISEPSKNNKSVWNIACSSSSTATAGITGKNTAYLSGLYQVCAMVKGGGQIKISEQSSGKSTTVTVVNDGNYRIYCSPISGSATQAHSFSPHVEAKPGSWVSIAYLQLNQIQTGTPVSPSSK